MFKQKKKLESKMVLLKNELDFEKKKKQVFQNLKRKTQIKQFQKI